MPALPDVLRKQYALVDENKREIEDAFPEEDHPVRIAYDAYYSVVNHSRSTLSRSVESPTFEAVRVNQLRACLAAQA